MSDDTPVTLALDSPKDAPGDTICPYCKGDAAVHALSYAKCPTLDEPRLQAMADAIWDLIQYYQHRRPGLVKHVREATDKAKKDELRETLRALLRMK